MSLFNRENHTYFYLLLILAIGIGLQIVLYKIAIIALVIDWILTRGFKEKFIRLSKNKLALLLIAFYFLCFLSVLWSDNKEVAIIDLILKLPLFILPFVIISKSSLTISNLNQIFLCFAFSSLVLNIYCFFEAYLLYLETNTIDRLYYSNLTLNMHTSSQSMSTCLSIIIFVYIFVTKKILPNWLTYTVVLLQITFVLLLSSRMQILIMMFIVPLYLILYYFKQGRVVLGLIYTLLIFGASYIVITAPSVLSSRFSKTVSQISSIGVDNENSDPRKFIWAEALTVIKKNWILGAGVGDAKSQLVDRYSKLILDNPISQNLVDSTVSQIQKNNKTIAYLKKKAIENDVTFSATLINHAKYVLNRKNSRYKTAYKRKYNFHNQYLQTFGSIGILGFLILVLIICYPLLLSIKNKDYLFMLFLFVVGSSFLTESMFERQGGVSLFSFFYVLLIERFSQNKLF